ncbi:hypothetical protein H5410_013551 [Solanum commersonii]|uniref:Uncharacterized protein n=1 Tax=Solanum commersonii TaxID=4109 RepID=A0A9J5ZNS1_SOLCO|nr:hypothetical protein H5410_013551 [Solanum commersonii]
MRFIGDPEFRRHFCQKFTWTSVKTLEMEPVGHHSQNIPFSRSTTAKTAHFQVQTILESSKFIGDKEFRCHFFQKFTWTSVKTLVMKPVGDHGQNGPF